MEYFESKPYQRLAKQVENIPTSNNQRIKNTSPDGGGRGAIEQNSVALQSREGPNNGEYVKSVKIE